MRQLPTDPPQSPELSFVLLCLQGRFDHQALKKARLLSGDSALAWLKVRGIIERERLAPLIYSTTKECAWFPPRLMTELRRSYLDCAMHNARQLRELAAVVERLNETQIPLIVLKGAALAETIYSNIALRPMTDMDILVPLADTEAAVAILKSLGYLPEDPETHPGAFTAYENEMLMFKRGRLDAAIELHWSLLDSPHYQEKMAMPWFWETGVTAQVGYAKTKVLGPEALLLHLCAHLTLHHAGRGLLWLHDVAEVLVQLRQELNWQLIYDKASEFDLVLPLQQIIPQVNAWWHLSLDEEVLHKVAALQPSEREHQLYEWLTRTDRPVGERFLIDLATTPKWTSRLRYAWVSLFPTAEYMKRRYEIAAPLLVPFYYPYRWLLGLKSLIRH